jgi:hypothetical protein
VGLYLSAWPTEAASAEDEEFVWERRVATLFPSNRSWRITAIGPEASRVASQDRPADFVPRVGRRKPWR